MLAIFVLPHKTLKDIEAKLRSFLWSDLELKSGAAKLNRQQVCTPKQVGGLGFKKLMDWNRASIMRYNAPNFGGINK